MELQSALFFRIASFAILLLYLSCISFSRLNVSNHRFSVRGDQASGKALPQIPKLYSLHPVDDFCQPLITENDQARNRFGKSLFEHAYSHFL